MQYRTSSKYDANRTCVPSHARRARAPHCGAQRARAARLRAQLDGYVWITPRMMGWLERGRAHGPVTHAAAHAQQRAGSCGRARQERRTADDLDEAPLTAHLLEVLEEPRQPVVGAGARNAHLCTCGQNLSRLSSTQGLARDCRESATRRAWRFESVVLRTVTSGS